FSLNTGNVLVLPTSSLLLCHLAPALLTASVCSPCSRGSDISEMLRLARDKREGAILPRGLNPCAQQKRLSTPCAVRARVKKWQAFPLRIRSESTCRIRKKI